MPGQWSLSYILSKQIIGGKIVGRRTFASRCTDRYSVSRAEEVRLGDGIVDFSFKDVEEALAAYLLSRFRSFEHSFCLVAQSTSTGRHASEIGGIRVGWP